jgi:hypothetical protein
MHPNLSAGFPHAPRTAVLALEGPDKEFRDGIAIVVQGLARARGHG